MSEKITNSPHAGEEIIEHPLTMPVSPQDVLTEAQKAAAALQDVISKKKKSVMLNGELYIEFEDWQTLAKFYGLSAKVTETKYVRFDQASGFEARAVVVDTTTGLEVSAAEAMCLDDERTWSHKPLFQLRSMAQTRACAKALRNVLAWVVVLAGYRPTPAEEMQEVQPKAEFTHLAANQEVAEAINACPFGKNKGKKWSELNNESLLWYKSHFESDMNKPEKFQFYYQNKACWKGVMDELLLREAANLESHPKEKKQPKSLGFAQNT